MRTAITITALTIAAALAAGCTTTTPAERQAYMDAQLQLASEPTLSIDCPSGCSIDYTDPRDRSIQPMQTTNGWDAAIALTDGVLGAATTLGPWYGVTHLGVEAVQAVAGARGPTEVQNGDRIGGDQAGRDMAGGAQVDGDQIGRDYTGPVRGDTVGGDLNSGRVDSPDSTHEPTVVKQAEPVVVEGGSSGE